MAEDPDRVLDAKNRLRAALDEQLAMVKAEAIARLSEGYYRGDTRNFDSHIIGIALDELERSGEILIESPTPSRGGHEVATIQPADQRLRKTAIADAAARKRLLYARYLSWATGSVRYPHGFIGPAGEHAVRTALIESATLQPATANAGEIASILGVHLPGPADSGGFISPLVGGIPQPPVTVLIEVKSIRAWIYPDASELFQVLHKCVVLQQVHPTVPIVPILICRRAQQTAFYMAGQLGFFIIDMGAQFIGDTVDEQALLEVRNELHFQDVYRGFGPSVRVRDRLRKIVDHLAPAAATWATTALDPAMAVPISMLRDKSVRGGQRIQILNDLRDANRARGARGGW